MTMQPWMTQHEIQLIEQNLLSLNKKHLDVLEWGCGGSTSYFPEFLARHNIECRWTSIEHNHEWYEKVSAELRTRDNIDIHWFPAADAAAGDKEQMRDEYIQFPSTLNRKFDVILIDGRERRACAEQAASLLREDGIAFMHDAQRSRYHAGFRPFPDGRFLSLRLWRGRLHSVGVWQKLVNLLNYLYYRIVVKSLFRLRRDRDHIGNNDAEQQEPTR